MQASCRTADFAAVEATLRKWSEVEAVGSFREKNNNKKDITTVFVTFRDEESAKAAKSKLDAIPGIVDPSQHDEDKTNQNKGSQKKNKNLAAEFLKFESFEDKKASRSKKRNEKAVGEEQAVATNARGGRGARGNRGGRGGRGAVRGGRGGNNNSGNNNSSNANNVSGSNNHGGHPGNRGARGRGGMQQYHQPRLPPFEANVAFIDNVPFGTPNSYIMEHFSAFGRILDVNRLELMVMICYDNPESVQQCIQQMNGTKIHENVITVSSGTVRIPGSVAIQMGI